LHVSLTTGTLGKSQNMNKKHNVKHTNTQSENYENTKTNTEACKQIFSPPGTMGERQKKHIKTKLDTQTHSWTLKNTRTDKETCKPTLSHTSMVGNR